MESDQITFKERPAALFSRYPWLERKPWLGKAFKNRTKKSDDQKKVQIRPDNAEINTNATLKNLGSPSNKKCGK